MKIIALTLSGLFVKLEPWKKAHISWFEEASRKLRDPSLFSWATKENYFQGVDLAMKKLYPDLTEEERTIKYYEEALENVNNQVSYSTVYLTITEKRSDFANAAFIKFSQIVTSFVDSINSLINLIFVLIPWAIALLIIWLIYRKFKN